MVQQLSLCLKKDFNRENMCPCRILIIDDDSDDIEVLSDALLQSGFNSFHCIKSADEAITFLEACTIEGSLPRLIVIDLYLPANNGRQFLKIVQQNPLYNKIKIVVFSNMKLELLTDVDRNIGAADYIEKPCCYQDYLKIAVILDQKSAA